MRELSLRSGLLDSTDYYERNAMRFNIKQGLLLGNMTRIFKWNAGAKNKYDYTILVRIDTSSKIRWKYEFVCNLYRSHMVFYF